MTYLPTGAPIDAAAAPIDAAAAKEYLCARPGLSLGRLMLLFQWVDAVFAAHPGPAEPGCDLIERLNDQLQRALTLHTTPATILHFTPPQAAWRVGYI